MVINCFILSTLFQHSLIEITMNTKKVCNTIKYRLSHGWFEICFLQRPTCCNIILISEECEHSYFIHTYYRFYNHLLFGNSRLFKFSFFKFAEKTTSNNMPRLPIQTGTNCF